MSDPFFYYEHPESRGIGKFHKCVENTPDIFMVKVLQRAPAIDAPSRDEVPLPISSIITSDRLEQSLRITRRSSISKAKPTFHLLGHHTMLCERKIVISFDRRP